jgi:molybdate transport system regulatory protein
MVVLKLRIVFENAMLGPGKASLLAGIRDSGSISSAGRQMGMSYKRAWLLVDEMNRSFSAPLVISTRGGTAGGGAQLTELGGQVMALYDAALERATVATQDQVAALESLLAPPDDPTTN